MPNKPKLQSFPNSNGSWLPPASTQSPRRQCKKTMRRWAGPPARKLRKSVGGLTRVLAIEVLAAARGIDLRALVAGTGHRCSSRCCANTRAGPRHRSISGTRDRSSRSTRPKRRLGRSRRSHYRPATLTRCSVKCNNGDVHSTRPTLPSHFADDDLAFSF